VAGIVYRLVSDPQKDDGDAMQEERR
jgi:hypothetical protein